MAAFAFFTASGRRQSRGQAAARGRTSGPDHVDEVLTCGNLNGDRRDAGDHSIDENEEAGQGRLDAYGERPALPERRNVKPDLGNVRADSELAAMSAR